MRVYIDVTNLTAVNFLTGIQRVVREIVLRFLKRTDFETVLISYSNEGEVFNLIDNQKFAAYFEKGIGSKNEFYSHRKLDIADIEAGAVFFDIDSVWNSRICRSCVLPALRDNGVKIAVFVHDIIPITNPQYCHSNTVFFFMDYIGAYLAYADVIITSTETTLNEISKLSGQLGLEPKPGFVVPLGSDFKKDGNKSEVVDPDVRRTLASKKYGLIVGTIEPRKNHAVLLRAFEKALFARDMSLVFAGRFGWNVEELKAQIEKHPQLGKRFFCFTGANDATIDYLYKNAYLTFFPTFNEGFGLPLIESIQRGTPVVSSNCGVLQEIGTDYCKYFDPNNEDELIAIVERYLDHSADYARDKLHLKDYAPFTWDMSAERMADALLTLECKSDAAIPAIEQMVILSARDDILLETIPYIEHFMPFIQELVVCCPDAMAGQLEEKYNGRLQLKYLTDSMVLAGNQLPEDHSCRNFYLRCLAMKNGMIDEVFIMSDDDYRPLHTIAPDLFVKNGKYQAYYCYNLRDWTGTAGMPTSFDRCMFRTAEFLREHQYPRKLYASHQPQVIDKRIFLEMLAVHPGIMDKGYDEWSTYFNFGQFRCPDRYESVPYLSMSWPGAPTDWEMQVIPQKFVFENYYPEQYKDGNLFAGFSTQYHDDIVSENVQKVMLYMSRQTCAERERAVFDMYRKMYKHRYGEYPIFLVNASDDSIRIYLPAFVSIAKTGCTRFRFSLHNPEETPFRLEYYYTKPNGDRLTMPDGVDVSGAETSIELPVYGLKYAGTFVLKIACVMDTGDVVSQCPIMMV